MEDLYKMKLHEEIELKNGPTHFIVTRVPGGWIYAYVRLDNNAMMNVFVPLDYEFLETK